MPASNAISLRLCSPGTVAFYLSGVGSHPHTLVDGESNYLLSASVFRIAVNFIEGAKQVRQRTFLPELLKASKICNTHMQTLHSEWN